MNMQSNSRQHAATTIEKTPNNNIIITNHIPAQDLKTMRHHYATILHAIDEAIAAEKMQRENVVRLHQENAEGFAEHQRQCISIARIKAAHGLTIAQAKRISGSNHTMTRNNAAHGRKISKERKKAAIFELYQNGHNQARICKMLGYSAPYVSKEIKAQKTKEQQTLLLLTAI